MWPFDHAFDTYGWPGPFGWYATTLHGNVVAGFIQIWVGLTLGYLAHKLGLFEKLKGWLLKEIHEEHRKQADHRLWEARQIDKIHHHLTGEHTEAHPEHGIAHHGLLREGEPMAEQSGKIGL